MAAAASGVVLMSASSHMSLTRSSSELSYSYSEADETAALRSASHSRLCITDNMDGSGGIKTPAAASSAKEISSSADAASTSSSDGGAHLSKVGGDASKSAVPIVGRKQLRLSEYWIGLAYLFYGIEITVFAFALIYLREQGTGEFVVGVFSATADIPVLFRMAFGMLADSHDFGGLGHRRPPIGFGLALSAISFLSISFLVLAGNFQLWSFILLYFISQMGKEISQGTLDAYANEMSPREKAGRMQGVVIGANRVVGLFVGLGLGTYATSSRSDFAYFVMFLFVAIFMHRIINADPIIGLFVVLGLGTCATSSRSDFAYFVMFLFVAIFCIVPMVLTFWTKEPPVLSRFNWRQPVEEFKKRSMLALGGFMIVGGFLMSSNTLAFTGYLEANAIEGALFASYFVVFNLFFLVGAVLSAKMFDGYRSRLPWVFVFFISMAILSQLIFIVAEQTAVPELLFFFLVVLSTFGSALIVMAYSLAMLLIKNPISGGSIFAALHVFQAAGSVSAGLITGAVLEVSSFSVNCAVNIALLVIGLPLAFIAASNVPAYSNNVVPADDLEGDVGKKNAASESIENAADAETETFKDTAETSDDTDTAEKPTSEDAAKDTEREQSYDDSEEAGDSDEEADERERSKLQSEAVHVENVNGVQHIELAVATST